MTVQKKQKRTQKKNCSVFLRTFCERPVSQKGLLLSNIFTFGFNVTGAQQGGTKGTGRRGGGGTSEQTFEDGRHFEEGITPVADGSVGPIGAGWIVLHRRRRVKSSSQKSLLRSVQTILVQQRLSEAACSTRDGRLGPRQRPCASSSPPRQ